MLEVDEYSNIVTLFKIYAIIRISLIWINCWIPRVHHVTIFRRILATHSLLLLVKIQVDPITLGTSPTN